MDRITKRRIREMRFRQRQRKARIKAVSCLALLIMAGMFFYSLRPHKANAVPEPAAREQVTEYKEAYLVHTGDTLYGIAEEYKKPGMTSREYVRLVCRINGIENPDFLKEGDEIILVRYQVDPQ